MKEIVQIIKIKMTSLITYWVFNTIYQFFEYKFLPGEQPDESNLPKLIKVSKQRFDVIKKKVQNAKRE